MKYIILGILALTVIFPLASSAQAKVPVKPKTTTQSKAVGPSKPEFNCPEDSVSDASKKNFEKNFNKGKILYGLSCAQCHNLKQDKIEIIPDFSLPQLMDYEMRSYMEHSDKLSDKFVSDDEMAKIILFLRFKTRTGKTVRGEPTPVM